MTDLFESPKLLVERAGEHIAELDAAIRSFFDTRPYVRVVDFDQAMREEVHKVRLTAQLPARLRAILKDTTGNLRDALDHAVYASAVSLGVVNPAKTAFPFATDPHQLQGELASWKLADVPEGIKPLLASFKPYPTGNDLLVGLNRIRNPSTHRVLIPVGFASVSTSIGVSSGIITSGSMGYSTWHAETNEVEFMRLGSGSKIDYSVSVRFDVTFGDVEIVGGKPVIATLNSIFAEVNGVVASIEAETNKILGGHPNRVA